MSRDTVTPERVSDATLKRLREAGGEPEIIGAGAWDGLNLADFVHDLLMAREDAARWKSRYDQLRNRKRETGGR